jgi:hypothetical protein
MPTFSIRQNATSSAHRPVSREEVLRVLRRAGIRGEPADQLLRGLRFPAAPEEVDRQLQRHGVTRDWLISALGGSP